MTQDADVAGLLPVEVHGLGEDVAAPPERHRHRAVFVAELAHAKAGGAAGALPAAHGSGQLLFRRGNRRRALRVVSARQVSPCGCGAASMETICALVPTAGVKQ